MQMSANQNETGNNKIELVSSPHNCDNIKLILGDINSFFHESEQYQYNKEYLFAIVPLEKAFEKTFELQDVTEQEYTKFFRLIITEALKNIHKELIRMTSGFFRKKNYHRSLNKAKEALKEFSQEQPAGKRTQMQTSSTFPQDGKTSTIAG